MLDGLLGKSFVSRPRHHATRGVATAACFERCQMRRYNVESLASQRTSSHVCSEIALQQLLTVSPTSL